jgi:hypothetical protein
MNKARQVGSFILTIEGKITQARQAGSLIELWSEQEHRPGR